MQMHNESSDRPQVPKIDFFSELDPEVTFRILRKWVTSARKWATAKLVSKAWLPRTLYGEFCTSVTVHGFEYHSPVGSRLDEEELRPADTLGRLCLATRSLENGSFSNLHTLTLTCIFAPQDENIKASEPWPRWWKKASSSDPGLKSVQRLVLNNSWPFVHTDSAVFSSTFPNLTSLEVLYHRTVCKLPEDLGDLKALQVLKIDCHCLKCLPQSLTKLVNLQHLEVGGWYVKSLPAGMENLKKLSHIRMPLSMEQIEDSFFAMTSLVSLYTHGCCFFSFFSNDSLTKLKSLQELSLEGGVRAFLWEMTSLTKLELHKITEDFVKLPFSNLANLECLEFQGDLHTSHNTFSGLLSLKKLQLRFYSHRPVICTVARLVTLTSLSIYYSKLGAFSSKFQALKNLLELSLFECKLGEVPKVVFRLTNLTLLSLRLNSISHIPDGIGHSTQLRSLDISENSIDLFPAVLTKLTNLTALAFTIKSCPDQSKRQGLPGIETLSSLEVLSMDYWEEELPSAILKLTRLRCLSLKGSRNLPNLPDWFGQLTTLEELDICKTGLKMLHESFFQLHGLVALACDDDIAYKYRRELFKMMSLERVGECLKPSMHERFTT